MSNIPDFTFTIEEKPVELQMEIGEAQNLYPTYQGEYNVIPKVNEQELQTQNTVLKENVSVESIPKHEFENENGTTIVIGGIL